MYNCKFIADNGITFDFGVFNNNVFDIEGLSGLSVNLGTSQGAGQIGETVETKSINGQFLTIKGVIFQDIVQGKNALKRAFSAFASGKLLFNGKYYIYVYVQETPTISPIKNNGTFMLRLFAPFPFFKRIEESAFYIGKITPKFSFPVNYETPHSFGVKSSEKYINIINSGDNQTPFIVDLTTAGTSSNITITNISTFEFLKLNGVLSAGQRLIIYRDNRNQLKAELADGDKTIDVLAWIDEGSTLYELKVGDNLILATDDEGGDNLTAQIRFNEVVGAVYET